MAWYKKLHWQIILGLLLGTLYGVAAANWGWGGFTANWIATAVISSFTFICVIACI